MESTSAVSELELVKDYGVILLHNALTVKEQKTIYKDVKALLKPSRPGAPP